LTQAFDPNTIYCVVKSRLDLGESPQTIFDELKGCQVIDISALRAVLRELAPDRFTEKRYAGHKRGTLHQFLPIDGTDGG